MKRTAILLLAALVAAPSVAQAACKKSDVGGTWMLYAGTNDPAEQWFRCRVRLNSTGRLAGGNNYCWHISGPRSSIFAAEISVSRSCRVSGFFASFGDAQTFDHAWMSGNKQVISGVGHNPDNTFTFNAVRL